MYEKLTQLFTKFFKPNTIFKYLFNLSPMYRRSTGRLYEVSDDLHSVKIKIPLSWKNKNYVGTMFGGSMLSATDPIYMIQLLQILGKEYVVWDKSSTIRFKRPANEMAFANFEFSTDEIGAIKKEVAEKKELDLVKKLLITSKNQVLFAELEKTIYISTKEHYKEKRKKSQKA